MPMQPRPSADTSRLLVPSLRFCICSLLLIREWQDGVSGCQPAHSKAFAYACRMMRALCTSTLLCAAVLSFVACHPGAIVDPDPKPSVGGTIAGVVRSGANPVIGRK